MGLASEAPHVLVDLPLAIDPAEILRFQGYKPGAVPDAVVRALFDEALVLGRALVRPRAALRWLPARLAADRLEAGGVAFTVPGLSAAWGAIEYLAAAVATIGGALEQRVRELWDARELPLAAMLDSVGSAAVESLAEYLNDLLCQQGLPHGLRVTNRVSPGYGDWDVADQRALFAICPGDGVGVTLNEACFMLPEKTITLVAGAGVAARVDHYFAQCARCWMRDCAYRRVPARASVRRDG
ncbi:MAG: hypothetical protein HY294_09170 [Candidatus Rokubacteria bacterium]|nr:hypothetical protein [Candidatus Rokubacteria bacterium]MBI3826156.1 hypothetical protein [Candidatus Rokubacteria bacterium]